MGDTMTSANTNRFSLYINIFFAGLLVFFTASNSNLHAQSSGAVEGYVEDATGAVIPNAEVSIFDENLGVERTVVSNETGLFRGGELPAGTY